jgi:hypothetical protein
LLELHDYHGFLVSHPVPLSPSQANVPGVTPYILLKSDGASFKAFKYRIYSRFTTVNLSHSYETSLFLFPQEVFSSLWEEEGESERISQ